MLSRRPRLPDTLPARVLLVVLVGVTVTVAAAWAILALDRERTEARIERFHQARMVADAADLLSGAADEQMPQLASALDRHGLRVLLGHPPMDGLVPDDSRLTKALEERLPGSHPEVFTRASSRGHGRQKVVRLNPIGGPSMTVILRDRSRPHPDGLPWFWLLPLILVGLATLVTVQLAIRPLGHLVEAARRFDGSTHLEPIPESGPREVREALAAFNRMQERIDTHLRERTATLAAISHDLKTPLTRLRLRAERIEDPELAAAVIRDIERMRELIDAGLDLASNGRSTKDAETVELSALLTEAVEASRELGGNIEWIGAETCPVQGRRTALRRLIDNLLDNARRYADSARLTLTCRRDEAEIELRDRGPGIDPEIIRRAFEPFFRAEPSRNPATGGTGLGLTISREIARGHGGDIRLANHDEGLAITVTLSRTPAATE
ncbi:MAG: sensor histidine kinase [Pseudomonadota bacterium]